MGMMQATHTHRRHAQETCLDTKRMLSDATQWGDHKKISYVYVRKDEGEAGEMITNIVH